MKFKEYSKPSPHIVIDNFLTSEEYDEVRNEINDLLPRMTPGKMCNDGTGVETMNQRKNNLNIWLNDAYPDRGLSSILVSLRKIWGNEMTSYLQNADAGIFRLYNITNSDDTLLTVYKNGAFYKKHIDAGSGVNRLFLTSNLMIGGKFKGGIFMLGNKIIPFKDNRLIIFESHREHQVTTVETDDSGDNWRYSIQYFAELKKT